MKTLVLGDIHGHTSWQDIVKKEAADQIIFLGDYVDTFRDVNPNANDYISPEMQAENLQQILDLPDDTTVRLIGNHDLHYLNSLFRCSGFSQDKSYAFKDIYLKARENNKIKYWHQQDDITFSHAGFCQTWIADYEFDFNKPYEDYELENMFAFNANHGFSATGNIIGQSPLWIRPQALISDLPDNLPIQIVGHTPTRKCLQIDMENIYLADALGFESYITIVDNKINII